MATGQDIQQQATDRVGFVRTHDEGDGFSWLGSLSINKVGATQSRGGLSIVDHRVPPGYAPQTHQHHDDETFFIIDGQFDIRCGKQSWQAGPGTLVFLPAGVPHGFVVSNDGPGRSLLITAPGGFDEVISGIGTPTTSRSLPSPDVAIPDNHTIQAVFNAHGIPTSQTSSPKAPAPRGQLPAQATARPDPCRPETCSPDCLPAARRLASSWFQGRVGKR